MSILVFFLFSFSTVFLLYLLTESETADKNRNTFAIIAIDTRFVPVKQFRCIDVSRSGAKENILRLKAKKLQ